MNSQFTPEHAGRVLIFGGGLRAAEGMVEEAKALADAADGRIVPPTARSRRQRSEAGKRT